MADDADAPAVALDGAQAATETFEQAPEASPVTEAPEGAEQAEEGQETAEPEMFPRSVVEELRKENADRRTRIKPYEETFDGWDPEDVQAYLEFGKAIQTDPGQAAEWARQLAEQLEMAGQPPQEFDPDQPLTAAQIDQFLQQREAQRAAQDQARRQNEVIEQLNRQALELDTKYVPQSEDHMRLMWRASQHNGDLVKAHESLQSERQTIRDEVIAELKAAANSGVQPVQPGSQAAPAPNPPKTIEEAGRQARQRLIDLGY